MIQVKSLNAGYRKLHVLYDVDFEALDKGITVIVGPNGSGKSTLLKSIVGLTTIYSGKILFEGQDITRVPAYKRARMGIVFTPQTDNVFSNLSVEENLRMALYTVDKSEYDSRLSQVYDLFPQLKLYRQRRAGELSGGERQMLALGMAMARKPKVLIMDEPTAQLSPKFARLILDKIVEINKNFGIPIILVEQNAKAALNIGDKAYLLVGGRVIYEGGAKDLLSNPELSKMYLGL